jgi:fatty acid desaturase
MQQPMVTGVSGTGLNVMAIALTTTLYGFGIWLLIQGIWWIKLIGMACIAYALVLSTVLTHEAIHGNLFQSRSLNEACGRLMTHLNGACYAPYSDIVQYHFNHHVHHADLVPFESSTFIERLPTLTRYIFLALEWLYFPAYEYVMRWRLIWTPFSDKQKHHLRGYTLGILIYRLALFGLLGWFSISALLLYGLAYICFVNLIRFVDAFHHTYDYVLVGGSIPARDRTYEDKNTFSNLVSTRHPWLNLLFLNFGYHNAHHYNMRYPWYQLSALHNQLYGSSANNIQPLPQLIKIYHRFRIQRLFSGQAGTSEPIGGVGVSLLTPP